MSIVTSSKSLGPKNADIICTLKVFFCGFGQFGAKGYGLASYLEKKEKILSEQLLQDFDLIFPKCMKNFFILDQLRIKK